MSEKELRQLIKERKAEEAELERHARNISLEEERSFEEEENSEDRKFINDGDINEEVSIPEKKIKFGKKKVYGSGNTFLNKIKEIELRERKKKDERRKKES